MMVRPCSREAAAILLRPALRGKANPLQIDAGEATDGNCFAMDDGYEPLGALVLQERGRELWIQAAAGRATGDLCDLIDAVTKQYGDFDTVAFMTHRRGLSKKAIDRGYEIAALDNGRYTMRKAL
jgi:hypothetical protein